MVKTYPGLKAISKDLVEMECLMLQGKGKCRSRLILMFDDCWEEFPPNGFCILCEVGGELTH